MKHPKVYVISKGSHSYEAATAFGDLVFLYDDNKKANVFASDALVKEIEDKLARSTAEDFLILSGSMVPAAIAFYVLMQKHGEVQNLLYSFKNNNYELRTIRRGQFAPAQEV